jgi:hypothetical protein
MHELGVGGYSKRVPKYDHHQRSHRITQCQQLSTIDSSIPRNNLPRDIQFSKQKCNHSSCKSPTYTCSHFLRTRREIGCLTPVVKEAVPEIITNINRCPHHDVCIIDVRSLEGCPVPRNAPAEYSMRIRTNHDNNHEGNHRRGIEIPSHCSSVL